MPSPVSLAATDMTTTQAVVTAGPPPLICTDVVRSADDKPCQDALSSSEGKAGASTVIQLHTQLSLIKMLFLHQDIPVENKFYPHPLK